MIISELKTVEGGKGDKVPRNINYKLHQMVSPLGINPRYHTFK